MSKKPDDILKDLLKRSEKVFTAMNPFFQDEVTIPYLKEIEGSTKQRIHNEGKDSNEQTIGLKSKHGGRYSPGYEKKKHKQQGEHFKGINLQLTGKLKDSYTVGVEENKPVLKFHDDPVYPSSSKFDGTPSSLVVIHSANYNTELYKPSDQEMEDAKEVLLLGIKAVLKKGFANPL